jgi:hypothetical protein
MLSKLPPKLLLNQLSEILLINSAVLAFAIEGVDKDLIKSEDFWKIEVL